MTTLLVLPGDGIGPEIIAQAIKVLDVLKAKYGLEINYVHGLIGGAAIDVHGVPLPEETLNLARSADAVLLGAVGGPKWEPLDISIRPEKGLLGIRAQLGVFANLRPAMLYPQLLDASTLRPEVIDGLDLMIVRELTGDIYFGQPRGIRLLENGEREGFNTLVYSETEIKRIAKVAFELARSRSHRLCSVDKANVLEATELWRVIVTDMGKFYPDVQLSHMYVDNAAMQLVRNPKQFDVIVTTNMFGDILSDLASMLTGSIGMLPSASLDENGKGLYEPIHGSAPDIAGLNIANPLATILSTAMLLRYSLKLPEFADKIEKAVTNVLAKNYRTEDIYSPGMIKLGTTEMGDRVCQEL